MTGSGGRHSPLPSATADQQTVRVPILIVGASVAGIRTAQALRRRGFDGEITILGEETHVPYDKPPLTKQMLAPDSAPVAVPLLPGEALDALGADLRLGVRAVALDPGSKTVVTADGGRVRYSTLVIATGLRPVSLPGAGELGGVYTIRSADDALALRGELRRGGRAVGIGAGFIGAEFASAAREHGMAVTVVEAQDTPMAHLLGAEVGAMLTRLHEANGVSLLTGVRFAAFQGTRHVTGVALSDGTVLPADVVAVGIGARANTEWLTSSGLPIADGVQCGADLRVTGFPDIYAAGDIARWRHGLYQEDLRIEHWTNANDHAEIVAASICGTPPPAAQVPFVWSDQYGRRIQIVGRPSAGRVAVVGGGVGEDSLSAVYADRDGIVVGAVCVDDARTMLKCRKAIARRQHVADLGLADKVAGPGR
jgi:NADPH-dependent 2,4-dienoyl-CoA reductase/sulfur reductase-like enzyme